MGTLAIVRQKHRAEGQEAWDTRGEALADHRPGQLCWELITTLRTRTLGRGARPPGLIRHSPQLCTPRLVLFETRGLLLICLYLSQLSPVTVAAGCFVIF